MCAVSIFRMGNCCGKLFFSLSMIMFSVFDKNSFLVVNNFTFHYEDGQIVPKKYVALSFFRHCNHSKMLVKFTQEKKISVLINMSCYIFIKRSVAGT